MKGFKRNLLCLWLGFALFLIPGVSKAAKGLNADRVVQALGRIGVRGAKVQGIEPLHVKDDVYMVFVKLANGREAAFVMSGDTRYLITGKVLDLSQKGKDLTAEIGYSKGYFPLPKGTEAKIKVDVTDSPSFGPKKAPQIVVYFDPLCPFCMRELRELKPMADRGKIHLVLKYFIVHGDKAKEIARNSLCFYQGGKTGEFWAYILSQGKVKLPTPKCDNGKVEFILARDGEEAKKLGLKGTPSIVMKGKVYMGYLGRTVVEKLLLTGGKS